MLNGKPFQLALAAACLVGSTSLATAAPAPDMRQLAGSAQLVVQTRVSKVDYRLARPAAGSGEAALPYTLVTYDIVRPVRGSTARTTLTLRYLGGPDGRGGFLAASHMPVFQVGEEDILFVQDDGTDGCALVGCIDGRFRLLAGAVHTGEGVPVRALAGDRVVASGQVPAAFRTLRFPAPGFDELIQNPEVTQELRRRGLSVEEARRRYAAEAPATIEMTAAVSAARASRDAGAPGQRASTAGSQQLAVAQPLAVTSFVAALQGIAATDAQRATTFSTGADRPLTSPALRPVAPAAPAASALAGPQRSPADIAEESSLPPDDPTIGRDKSR